MMSYLTDFYSQMQDKWCALSPFVQRQNLLGSVAVMIAIVALLVPKSRYWLHGEFMPQVVKEVIYRIGYMVFLASVIAVLLWLLLVMVFPQGSE